ncbi:unnamed protein product [Coffea canephora]|uniref:DH200=94 genomic scaffold, scaffold_191 n=1 Tax=Coffea canephora TaxID=49390 RepID=A0A068VB27_COFCA|nr:unnamed protein product [Coffea canephora]
MEDSDNQEGSTMENNRDWRGSDASSFYRIITQPVVDEGQLGLPKNFVKEYGDEICSSVRLNVPSGGIFRVGIEKDENMLWLRDGWQRFAEHHSLTFGYFLWFKYKGNSEFDVAIFDLTATEIDYQCCSNNSKKFNPVAETTVPEPEHDAFCSAKTDDRHPIEISSSSETEEVEIRDVTTDSGNPRSIRRRSRRRGKKISEHDVVTRLFKSDNPYFSLTMKEYNLGRCYIVHVPAEFSSTYLRTDKKSVELQDSDGNKWTVGVIVRYGRVISLSKGWCYFCRDHKLCSGDVCVFEVIKSRPVVIKVTIFPARESVEVK